MKTCAFFLLFACVNAADTSEWVKKKFSEFAKQAHDSYMDNRQAIQKGMKDALGSGFSYLEQRACVSVENGPIGAEQRADPAGEEMMFVSPPPCCPCCPCPAFHNSMLPQIAASSSSSSYDWPCPLGSFPVPGGYYTTQEVEGYYYDRTVNNVHQTYCEQQATYYYATYEPPPY